MEADQHEFSW